MIKIMGAYLLAGLLIIFGIVMTMTTNVAIDSAIYDFADAVSDVGSGELNTDGLIAYLGIFVVEISDANTNFLYGSLLVLVGILTARFAQIERRLDKIMSSQISE